MKSTCLPHAVSSPTRTKLGRVWSLVAALASLSVASVSAVAALPARVFAPYIQMNSTTSLTSVSSASGIKYFTLAFIIDDGTGHGLWEAGSTVASDTTIAPAIANLRAAGGDVIISFGGEAGSELATTITNVSTLQSVYQGIIDKYGVTALDFDIEGAAIADTASNDRRNQALAGLQAANPGLFISYTLPVDPSGLQSYSIALLQNAKSHGVNVACVNIMAMDYGSSTTPSMGQDAIDATNNTIAQLSANNISTSIGITPLIGNQDTAPEVFTISDAQTVENFAVGNSQVNRIAFWEVARDQCGSSCTGVSQSVWQFSHIFEPFSGGTTSTAAAPTFSPGGGTYSSAQSVSISTTTSGASIRYTTDGSTPTSTTGTLYSGPVAVSSSETLKAIAYASGYTNSSVSSATYTINATLPTGWSDVDVGAPAMAGSASYSSGTFTVIGGGSDIWGASDQFNYVYQSTSGDATITAQVATQPATNAWTKSGVMFRGSTAANDIFVDVFVTPSNGVAMQYRSAVGGTSTSISGTAGVVAPYWVRLVRSGTTFTGYSSADGTTWTQVGSITLSMATSATAGLEVCAHTTTATNTSTFQSVSLGSSTPSTFTITASAGTGGTISPSGSVAVTQGASQTFTIAANSGNAISSVTVDGTNVGAVSSYTFGNVQANHTISAAFSTTTSSNVAPNGTAYGWSANTSSTANTNRAAQPGLNDNNLTNNVDLDPAGDAISAWEGAGVVWSSAQTITSAKFINGDITTGGDGFLTANCTLQYSTDGSTWTNTGWTITPAYPNSSSAGGQTYSASGTALSGVLGMRFVGQVRSTDTSYHWIVKEVQFIGSGGGSPTNYTITSSAGTGGTISPSGSVSVTQGANQTFTISASSGYAISSVTVDGTNVGAVSTYTFSNVQANHTISAAFSAVTSTFTITASAGTGGTISPSGSVSVTQGASQTFTIAPNPGYATQSVIVDGVNMGVVTSYTFSNVQGNHTISAGFIVVSSTFTITASAGTGGTISPSGSVSVTQGASQTFTIAANSGYTISGVTVDGASAGAVSTYTFSNVQANHTISAAFSAVTSSNIAPSGTAYGWSANTSSTANTNRAAQPGLNDNNLTNNVDLDPAGDAIGAWEGAGVVWSSAVNITSAKFINGDITTGGDGFLTASCTLQYSTDGSTWTNTGWTISPSYPNSSSAGGQTYTASGTALSGVLGMRFVGQVRTTDTSYHWIVKEVQFIGTTGGSTGTSFTITSSAGTGGTISPSGSVSVAQGANQTFTITASSGYTIAGVTVDGASVGAVTTYTFGNVQANHTISASFNSSGGGTVAAPTFSPAPGSYTSAQSVTISTTTSGASIRYTLDGSTPSSTTGTVYAGPVSIASSATLNAIAYETGFTSSSVTSGFYSIGSSGSVTTTGTISFHLLLGSSSSQDSLTLTGDNYTDLIMSNVIAGVMYGHIVQEYFPGIQYNKDYLGGSIFGQLLQENLATQDYTATSNLIDPSPDQQAVMGAGQGGPYQINNYAIDMVSGSYTPAGHSLINYIAVQKNIGYTMATAANQYSQPTPPSFNNKYYGPMLCAFFHYNDMVAMNVIGKGPNGWTTPWEPAYDQAMANFVSLPNSFLDVILNVAYNQGYYGTLLPHYSQLGATATSSTVASVNSYSSVWGSTDTYQQYPYQVHYYLDQVFDNPIPTTSPSNTVTPTNHVAIPMSTLGTVFSNVAQTLSYSNGTNAAQFFTASQAQAAFNSGLSQNGVSSTATFDLSRASDRTTIYNVIDSALSYLESVGGMKFNSTTNSQL